MSCINVHNIEYCEMPDVWECGVGFIFIIVYLVIAIFLYGKHISKRR